MGVFQTQTQSGRRSPSSTQIGGSAGHAHRAEQLEVQFQSRGNKAYVVCAPFALPAQSSRGLVIVRSHRELQDLDRSPWSNAASRSMHNSCREEDMDDMYNCKKRTAVRIAQIRTPSKKGLADLEEDACTVVIPQPLEVVDQVADSRDHFEPEEPAAIESRSESPEEMGSGDRSVLGEGSEQPQSDCDGGANLAQEPQSCGGKTIRVVISRQQLAKLLAEGSIKNSSGCKSLLPPSPTHGPLVGMAEIISNAMQMTESSGCPWSPRLDTITEAPLQLTRSPVITRNCEAVAHFLQKS